MLTYNVQGESIEYSVPQKPHVGFVIDPENPCRQVSDWAPCAHRTMTARPRECGKALITMFCNCDTCPLKGRIIHPDDCEECNHAKT